MFFFPLKMLPNTFWSHLWAMSWKFKQCFDQVFCSFQATITTSWKELLVNYVAIKQKGLCLGSSSNFFFSIRMISQWSKLISKSCIKKALRRTILHYISIRHLSSLPSTFLLLHVYFGPLKLISTSWQLSTQF